MEDWSWQRPAYLADTSGAALHGKFALHIDLHAFEINRQMFHGFDRSFALHEPVLDSVEVRRRARDCRWAANTSTGMDLGNQQVTVTGGAIRRMHALNRAGAATQCMSTCTTCS